ncbi:MAG: 50S ribosomal protein L23 [Dehalococcoidia bacterium]|nr:50S ribosomal protein L23 [Dehalococcoidia bacterium]MDD5494631.1 50S ribosomal protein L23 [Dehalococcoidia bacterium]
MNVYEILRRPLVTEKVSRLGEQNKYAFEVNKKASKEQIKQAVEKSFKVGVIRVNIINVPGETRRLGRRAVTRASWKKAVVTLKEGDKIQYFEGV